MSEIELQDFIFQIKRELLAPNPREQAKDPYPLFYIERIELEIAVRVKRSSSGEIRLTVLDFAELGANKSVDLEKAHVVKVSLSSLLSREGILEEVLQDPAFRTYVESNAKQAFIKGDPVLAGAPE